MNKVCIIGRIASEPLKYPIEKFNKNLVKFAIAVANRTQETTGEKIVFYFECEAWAKVADLIYDNCEKGNKIGIDGHLEQAKFTKKDGSKGSIVKIVVSGVELIETKKSINDKDLKENALEESEEELEGENWEDDKLPF